MDTHRSQVASPSQRASAGAAVAQPPRPTTSAPIPSPTMQQSLLFPTFKTQGQMSQQSWQHQQPHPQRTQPTPVPANTYDPDRTGAGSTAQETSSLIDSYALVAEAAKRAQMHVLMRDMAGVDLQPTTG